MRWSAGSMRLTPDQKRAHQRTPLARRARRSNLAPRISGPQLRLCDEPERSPRRSSHRRQLRGGPADRPCRRGCRRDPGAQHPPATAPGGPPIVIWSPGLGAAALGEGPRLVDRAARHPRRDGQGAPPTRPLGPARADERGGINERFYADPRYLRQARRVARGEGRPPTSATSRDSLEMAEAAGARWALLAYPAGGDESQVAARSHGGRRPQRPDRRRLAGGRTCSSRRLGGAAADREASGAASTRWHPTIAPWSSGLPGGLPGRARRVPPRREPTKEDREPRSSLDNRSSRTLPRLRSIRRWRRSSCTSGSATGRRDPRRGGSSWTRSTHRRPVGRRVGGPSSMVLYQRVAGPGGVDGGELAQLAELYPSGHATPGHLPQGEGLIRQLGRASRWRGPSQRSWSRFASGGTPRPPSRSGADWPA